MRHTGVVVADGCLECGRCRSNVVLHFGSYQVGSVNFSRRKIGHAHDNSVDSENVAGACELNVHAHFIFRFENGQGIKVIIFDG